jgi:hypothetical protein
MAAKLSRAQLIAIAHRHGQAEAARDLPAILDTLDAEPVYEFFPVGLGFRGAEATRRWYEAFVNEFMPRVSDSALYGEWIGDTGVAQEYSVQVRGDDGRLATYRIVGILMFGETGLKGERIYAAEELLRLLAGSMWSELRPL